MGSTEEDSYKRNHSEEGWVNKVELTRRTWSTCPWPWRQKVRMKSRGGNKRNFTSKNLHENAKHLMYGSRFPIWLITSVAMFSWGSADGSRVTVDPVIHGDILPSWRSEDMGFDIQLCNPWFKWLFEKTMQHVRDPQFEETQEGNRTIVIILSVYCQ